MRKKPTILDQLIDELEKIRVAKYERKRTLYVEVQEIECNKIKKKN